MSYEREYTYVQRRAFENEYTRSESGENRTLTARVKAWHAAVTPQTRYQRI